MIQPVADTRNVFQTPSGHSEMNAVRRLSNLSFCCEMRQAIISLFGHANTDSSNLHIPTKCFNLDMRAENLSFSLDCARQTKGRESFTFDVRISLFILYGECVFFRFISYFLLVSKILFMDCCITCTFLSLCYNVFLLSFTFYAYQFSVHWEKKNFNKISSFH